MREELIEKLIGKSKREVLNILWQWIKNSTLTFKEFEDACKYVAGLNNE